MNKKTPGVPRRTFLKTAGSAVAVGAVAAPHVIPSGVLAAQGQSGANDRLTFGHIGVGGMGGYHLRDMVGRMNRGEVNIAAVCDIDDKRLANASRAAGPQADCYRDYRYVLDRKDIDAVVVATPDHWHAVQTVHAAERGKHVYVEKPACCTVEEGKAMIAAANKAGIAVQVGSQGRSQPEAYLAHRYLANGNIGRVTRVDCFHYPSPSGATAPDSDPPPDLDWEFWLGPLRYRPYNRGYCHGTFRWMMESGGGQIRDRGAHVMSCAMWWMNADGTGPVEVEATGEAPKKGLWNSAVKINVKYTFKDPDWVLTWNQPGEPAPPEERTGNEPGGRMFRSILRDRFHYPHMIIQIPYPPLRPVYCVSDLDSLDRITNRAKHVANEVSPAVRFPYCPSVLHKSYRDAVPAVPAPLDDVSRKIPFAHRLVVIETHEQRNHTEFSRQF